MLKTKEISIKTEIRKRKCIGWLAGDAMRWRCDVAAGRLCYMTVVCLSIKEFKLSVLYWKKTNDQKGWSAKNKMKMSRKEKEIRQTETKTAASFAPTQLHWRTEGQNMKKKKNFHWNLKKYLLRYLIFEFRVHQRALSL